MSELDPSEDNDAELCETRRTAYREVCRSHLAITEFRAKLLALLPIVSGAAGALLLGRIVEFDHLAVLGVFGFAVSLGLFMYELRGIQLCNMLKCRAEKLEQALKLEPCQSQFQERPDERLGGMAGAGGAASIIYPAVMLAWVYIAVAGFTGGG